MSGTIARATLATNVENIRRRIADATERAGREPGSVTLVAVAKTVDRAIVDAGYDLGLRHFGENRVQDSVRKYADPLPSDADLHLIGRLQSNKARQAAPLFSVIESVDRPSLIDALEREAERLGRRLSVLLQVNVAGEAQKAGCAPDDAPALAARILASPGFDLRGLMTIAPLVPDPEQVRPVFRGLHDLRATLQDRTGAALPVLSMGMSDDFAVAVAEGATHVRVGRAVFAD